MTPAELARARVQRWKEARMRIASAMLVLDPIEDEAQVDVLCVAAAALDVKIAQAGGT